MPRVGYLLAFWMRRLPRAACRLASAILRVWLASATCGSRVLRPSSWKMVHHAPRGMVSWGLAVCQSGVSLKELGGALGLSSLKAGAVATEWVLYLGPTMQPARARVAARDAMQAAWPGREAALIASPPAG